jgi:hypothetical protein
MMTCRGGVYSRRRLPPNERSADDPTDNNDASCCDSQVLVECHVGNRTPDALAAQIRWHHGCVLTNRRPRMPEKATVKRARADKRAGKAPTTQAGEFVREEIHHIREGKHGAQSTKQAIAIGLSKARRSGVKLPRPPANAKRKTKRSASNAARAARHGSRRPSRRRSRAVIRALKREGRSAASRQALARQARTAARRRPRSARRASARRAVRTKGPQRRRAAAQKAARTRQRRRRHAD